MRLIGAVWLLIFLSACSHTPRPAVRIDAEVGKAQPIGESLIEFKQENSRAAKTPSAAEELKHLQYDVFELEDRIYGSRKYGSRGLYGALKECRSRLTTAELGPEGKLVWTESDKRVTDGESALKLVVNDKGEAEGVSQAELKDRLSRFKGYRKTLEKRHNDFTQKLHSCDAAVRARTGMDKQSAK